MSLTFENVLDDSVLLFLENYSAFADWIHQETGGGSGQVKIDLAMRQITFLPKLVKRNEVVAPLHLIATVDENGLAQWAWAHPHFADKPVSTLSGRVRDFGAQNQIPELTTSTLPGANPLALGAAACRITGMPVAHLMASGPGQVVLALDPAGFLPPDPRLEPFQGLLDKALDAHLVQDGRRAVQGYAQGRGVPYRWGPGFGEIALDFPDGTLVVAFDPNGRPQPRPGTGEVSGRP